MLKNRQSKLRSVTKLTCLNLFPQWVKDNASLSFQSENFPPSLVNSVESLAKKSKIVVKVFISFFLQLLKTESISAVKNVRNRWELITRFFAETKKEEKVLTTCEAASIKRSIEKPVLLNLPTEKKKRLKKSATIELLFSVARNFFGWTDYIHR